MGGWMLARGKAAEQTLAEVVPAGAREIALAGADAIFAPGDPLFVSEADGAETEFLGAATAVSPSAIEFALALRRSKDSGALLWRAESFFASGGEEALPLHRRVDPGVAVERSLGGEVYAVRTAESASTMDWELTGLTPEREAAFLDWLEASAGGGLQAFTLVAPDRRLEAVQLRGAWLRTARPGGRRAVELPLLVLGAGLYR